jgi:uncharacterized damage-inducible protein DinB
MYLQSIKLFARYNERTNIEMNKIISELSHAQWEKQFNGYFNSIKSMCNHIYICDFNWLKSAYITDSQGMRPARGWCAAFKR